MRYYTKLLLDNEVPPAALLQDIDRLLDENADLQGEVARLAKAAEPAPRREYKLPSLNLWRIQRRPWLRRALLVVTVLPMFVVHLLWVVTFSTVWMAVHTALGLVIAPYVIVANLLRVIVNVPGMFARCWRGDLPPEAVR